MTECFEPPMCDHHLPYCARGRRTCDDSHNEDGVLFLARTDSTVRYQYPQAGCHLVDIWDAASAAEALRRHVRDNATIMTYGQSMGIMSILRPLVRGMRINATMLTAKASLATHMDAQPRQAAYYPRTAPEATQMFKDLWRYAQPQIMFMYAATWYNIRDKNSNGKYLTKIAPLKSLGSTVEATLKGLLEMRKLPAAAAMLPELIIIEDSVAQHDTSNCADFGHRRRRIQDRGVGCCPSPMKRLYRDHNRAREIEDAVQKHYKDIAALGPGALQPRGQVRLLRSYVASYPQHYAHFGFNKRHGAAVTVDGDGKGFLDCSHMPHDSPVMRWRASVLLWTALSFYEPLRGADFCAECGAR